MNEFSKKINKEEIDIRMVASELGSLVRIFIRMQTGAVPVSAESKAELRGVIKDYCDTISQYVDLF